MSKKIIFRIVIISSSLLLVGAVIYLIIHFLDEPSQGTVSNTSIPNQPVSSFNFKPVVVSGTYVTFNYPAALSVEPNSKLVSPVLATYNYSYNDILSWNLSISILSIPGGSLMSDNSYQFRKINPKIYVQSVVQVNGKPVVVMSDQTATGFSKVAFLVTKDYQATVSLYGNDLDGTNNLEKTFLQVLDSWQWKLN